MATFEEYYAANPVEVFDMNRWDVTSPIIAATFHRSSYWTPLMGYVDLASPDRNNFMGTQVVRGHVNPEPIGLRQKMVNPMYFDSKRRNITGHLHYGQKIQMEELDKLLNMWQMGQLSTDQVLIQIAEEQLSYSAWWTMEWIAKKAYLTGANMVHFGPHGEYSDFSEIRRDPANVFDLNSVKQIKLRLSVRAQSTLDRFGTFANPVPGRSGQILMVTTPGVVHDMWSRKNQFMVNLKTLQDQKIMRGGAIEYFDFTVQEVPWDISVAWNAGLVDKQVAVYAYEGGVDENVAEDRGIQGGDGAPHPTRDDPVWGMYQVGQTAVPHYIQCSPFDEGDYKVGDRVSIHTRRFVNTGTLGVNWFGINHGCDFFHGETQTLEIAAVDHVNNRLSFSEPITYDYPPADGSVIAEEGDNVLLANAANELAPAPLVADRDVVAFVTKAQHMHPVVVAAARGCHVFGMMRPIRVHLPTAIDDFEQVQRVTWNMRGAPNKWLPDLYEVYWVAGSSPDGRTSDITL